MLNPVDIELTAATMRENRNPLENIRETGPSKKNRQILFLEL